MTQDYIREMLEESVRDPMAFADLLRIKMSTRQRDLLAKITTATGRIDIEADQNGDVARAAVLALFWRTLKTPLATGIILANKREERRSSMEFVHRIAHQHSALQAVTQFKDPYWWRCIFGFRPNWQIVAPTPRVEQLVNLGFPAYVTVIVMGSAPEMLPAVKCCEAHCDATPSSLVIQLW